MSTLGRLAAAAFLAVALPAPCLAQDPAEVLRPEISPGERWAYRRTNHAGVVVAILDHRVTFADARVIHVVVALPMQKRENDATFTSEWNVVMSGRGVWTPHSGTLKFPLRVGAEYSAQYEMAESQQGRSVVTRRATKAKVVGWEEVVVPAGKFRALRVELQGTQERLDLISKGNFTAVVWYAPTVKRMVKATFDAGPSDQITDELTEFSIK